MTSIEESSGSFSADCFPVDFLRQVFLDLDTPDLCAASMTCQTWRETAAELWPSRVDARWQYGWTNPRWVELRQSKNFIQLYAERHKIDVQAAEALEAMPWPLRRDQAKAKLLSLGTSCYDRLIQVYQDQHLLGIGRRYWSWSALQYLQVMRCASEIGPLMSSSCSNIEAWRRIEQGTLLISQVHYPLSEISDVACQLDLLAEELKIRLEEQGCLGMANRKALQVLNGLLFGSPAAPGTPGRPKVITRKAVNAMMLSKTSSKRHWRLLRCTLDPTQEQDATPRICQISPKAEDIVPSPGFGLGLKGNRVDYQNPRNSLLPDVLATRLGIPISLSIIHMLVGRRVGLPINLINMPMHVISRMEPDDGDETLYIDAYNEGSIMGVYELQIFMTSMGLTVPMERLLPLTPQGACHRMCANLVEIYGSSVYHEHLAMVLEIITAVNPRARDYFSHQTRTLLILSDYEGAMKACKHLKTLALTEEEPLRRKYIAKHMDKWERRINEMQVKYHEQCMKQVIGTPSVLFSVGDVICHRRHSYRGVVVEWDTTCNTKEEWIQQMGVDLLPGGRMQPFYRVLVDTRDRSGGQTTYVAQCNIELLQPGPEESPAIVNPKCGEYFNGFDGTRYIPNAYLHYRFPDLSRLTIS